MITNTPRTDALIEVAGYGAALGHLSRQLETELQAAKDKLDKAKDEIEGLRMDNDEIDMMVVEAFEVIARMISDGKHESAADYAEKCAEGLRNE